MPEVGLSDPGHEIDSEALRHIYFGLRGAVEGVPQALASELGIYEESEALVAVFVELEDQHAASVAKSIGTLDLLWRLAGMATELGESQLPSSGGTTDLENLLPASEYGFSIEHVEIGSLKIWFKENQVTIQRAAALLSAIASIGSFGIKVASVAADQPPQSASHPTLIRQLDEATVRALKENSSGIPPNSSVKVTIRLPDGTTIETDLRRGA